MDRPISLGQRFGFIGRSFKKKLDEMLKEEELTGVQFHVLSALVMLEDAGRDEISQKDLELRGPGDIFGTRQSGSALGLNADAIKDTELLYTVHALAKEITASKTPEAIGLKRSAQTWMKDKNEIIFSQN